jgi:hypothetical protein
MALLYINNQQLQRPAAGAVASAAVQQRFNIHLWITGIVSKDTVVGQQAGAGVGAQARSSRLRAAVEGGTLSHR